MRCGFCRQIVGDSHVALDIHYRKCQPERRQNLIHRPQAPPTTEADHYHAERRKDMVLSMVDERQRKRVAHRNRKGVRTK